MVKEKVFRAFLPTGPVRTIYLRGTIQEVLNSLADHNCTAENVISWTDDGVNAVCIFSMI